MRRRGAARPTPAARRRAPGRRCSRTASTSRFTHGIPSASAPASPASRSTARSTDTVVWLRASPRPAAPACGPAPAPRGPPAGSRSSCCARTLIGRSPASPGLEIAADAGLGPRSGPGPVCAWPGVYPLPTSMVTSAASPSAPSAAAVNEVAIEKKITVPPCGGGQDRAALAAGHVHAHDRHVGRAAGRLHCRRERRPGRARRRSRPASASPAARSAAASASSGTTPMILAGAGPAGGGQRTATRSCPPRRARRPRAPAACDVRAATTRWVSAGAPHTSITASGQRRRAGRRAAPPAIERPNRIAWPAHGTCSDRAVPAGQAVGDDQRREAERDQRGDPVARLQPERRFGPDLARPRR